MAFRSAGGGRGEWRESTQTVGGWYWRFRRIACLPRRFATLFDLVTPDDLWQLITATGGFMSLKKRAVAESIGTFWLVFGGCGSAVLAAAFPSLGIGFLGVALAFGLTLL